jgi:hypothetical protein
MEDFKGLVEETWTELGYKIRPLRWMVFVRTDPFVGKIGSIHVQGKDNYFYGALANSRLVTAVVLAAGKAGLAQYLNSGDRICFQRLYFTWYKKMEDGTLIGWVDANQVTGFVDGDSSTGFIPIITSAKMQPAPI